MSSIAKGANYMRQVKMLLDCCFVADHKLCIVLTATMHLEVGLFGNGCVC